MAYAPRNVVELQALCRIIEAATYWVSGESIEIDIVTKTTTKADIADQSGVGIKIWPRSHSKERPRKLLGIKGCVVCSETVNYKVNKEIRNMHTDLGTSDLEGLTNFGRRTWNIKYRYVTLLIAEKNRLNGMRWMKKIARPEALIDPSLKMNTSQWRDCVRKDEHLPQ